MDTLRYVIAVMLLVGLPPGLMLWFFIHPFASFWRRFGPVWTYVILTPGVGALMAWFYLNRARLLGSDFGTSYPLVALAVVGFAVSASIAVKRRHYLTAARLVGVPELSEQHYPGELLKEGLYAKVRHPRYVEVLLASLAYALLANYVGTYVLVIASVPTIHVLVLLEERELHRRFGAAYTEYCANVPRYLPRRSRRP